MIHFVTEYCTKMYQENELHIIGSHPLLIQEHFKSLFLPLQQSASLQVHESWINNVL